MWIRVGSFKIWLASCDSLTPKPPKNPVSRKDLGHISYRSRLIAVVSNFVAVATGVGRGGFLWHRSIARPWKPLLGASFSAIFPYKFLTPPPVTDCYILLIPPNNYAIFDHPPPLAPSTPVETTCRNLQLLWLYVNSVIFFIFLFSPAVDPASGLPYTVNLCCVCCFQSNFEWNYIISISGIDWLILFLSQGCWQMFCCGHNWDTIYSK